MTKENNKEIIKSFYEHYNNLDLDDIFSLFDANIKFRFNMRDANHGIESYKEYMRNATVYTNEKVSDVVIAATDDGKYVATKFVFSGQYVSTDPSLGVEATGQSYKLEAINIFTLNDDNKIIEVEVFYDENDYIAQLGGVVNNLDL
jgi:steroid delta-isomerase-like uncharacterized protein